MALQPKTHFKRKFRFAIIAFMKTIMLILFLVLCPLISGYGFETLLNLIRSAFKKGTIPAKNGRFATVCVSYAAGFLIMLLISGIANLLCVFLNLGLATGSKLFAGMLIGVVTIFYFIIIISRLYEALNRLNKKTSLGGVREIPNPFFPVTAIVLSGLSLFLSATSFTYLVGDQTIETVNSFISTGELYSVNPLTGLPYTGGFPTRLKLMCLPFFYSVLCRTFDIDPKFLLDHIVPVFVSLGVMSCFYALGDTLFKPSERKLLFYCVCMLLLLCTPASIGSPGFDLLHAGYRGSTMLLFIVSFCLLSLLRKKWGGVLLTIILEPLIASTAFGIGACFALSAGVTVISLLPPVKRILNQNKNDGEA